MRGVKTCEIFSIADNSSSNIKGHRSDQEQKLLLRNCSVGLIISGKDIMASTRDTIEGDQSVIAIFSPHRVYERRRRAPCRYVPRSKRMSALLPFASVEDAFFCAEDAFRRPC